MARGLGVLFFVLLPALWIAAVAAVEGANDGLTAYEFTRYLHQLLFVYWIGPDIGVYYLSHRITDSQLSVGQRLAAAEVMGQIDLIPRVCLSLMLTVGGILTEFVGIPHPAWQMAGIVLLGPVWLTMILIIYFRRGTPLADAVCRGPVVWPAHAAARGPADGRAGQAGCGGRVGGDGSADGGEPETYEALRAGHVGRNSAGSLCRCCEAGRPDRRGADRCTERGDRALTGYQILVVPMKATSAMVA